MPRPPKKLSKKDLEEIEAMAARGLTQQQIADIKGICVETLVKYGATHYCRGKSKGIGKVCQTAFNMATSGKHGAMTRFYLRTQAGWTEKHLLPDELRDLLRESSEEDDHED
jgi:hypothetical protein